MRTGIAIVLACFIAASAPSAALAPAGKSMPDMGRQHHQRFNCHGVYDLLVEDHKSGRPLSDAHKAWVGAYEANAEAGKPCPDPDAALAERAANHLVVTQPGLGHLALYHKQKDATAYFEAAQSVFQGKAPGVEPKVGLELLVMAERLGDPDAQYMIGMLHAAGSFGVKEDYKSALPLVEAAAKAGHVDAMFQAGNFYSAGLGVKKDGARAFDYYRQAAERGHIFATYLAASMVNSGDGVRTDHILAYRLARNLADRGEAVGAVLAASALLQQKNAKAHEDEVLYWLDRAINDGDSSIKAEVSKLRPQVVAAYQRAKAPPEYQPRRRKLCPTKTVCLVNHFSGIQRCTTNVDYWNDCDTGLGAP